MPVRDERILNLDLADEAERIVGMMRQYLRKVAHRRGFVVAVSGGIDSSVCAALAVKAVGQQRVLLLRLPETDSSAETMDHSVLLSESLGCETLEQNITGVLEQLGCYRWRDQAMQQVFPDYGDGWKSKITIDGGLRGNYNHFELVVEDPQGKLLRQRLEYRQYLQIVAATNYKQRTRKTIEYFHADRLNYAVVGTPNLLEYDQGFFVKNGDGSADIKPIAHLYKSQVFALAEHLGIPQPICNAAPTTDTYSMAQGQDEFYFSLPYQQMDVALWCYRNGVEAAVLADEISVSLDEAEYIYRDIEVKRKMTRYLEMNPEVLASQELEIGA